MAAAGAAATADVDDHDGISWGANPLTLNGGSIQFMSDDVTARVDARRDLPAQPPLSGHKVDTEQPTLLEAQFDDAEIYLVYSEDLNTTAPANSVFSVSVAGGTGANPSSVAIAGNTVTLTLASAAARDQTVTVSYTKPASNANPIRDLSGREADGFMGQGADPATDIENLSASPGDRQVTLTWDRLVDGDLTRFQYRYMTTADARWSPDWTDVQGSNADTTSVTLRNLTNGIEYTFEIRPVYTRSGLTEFGREDDVKAAPRGALVAPRGLTATRGGTAQIILFLGRPQRRHTHRVPVPLPARDGKRLEPRLDGHAGKRANHHVAHDLRFGLGGALHLRTANGARRHGGSGSKGAGQAAGGPQPAQRGAGPAGRHRYRLGSPPVLPGSGAAGRCGHHHFRVPLRPGRRDSGEHRVARDSVPSGRPSFILCAGTGCR